MYTYFVSLLNVGYKSNPKFSAIVDLFISTIKGAFENISIKFVNSGGVDVDSNVISKSFDDKSLNVLTNDLNV